MSGFSQFGFGDGDDGIGGKSNRFKGQGGQNYRISFAWWPGIEDGDLDLDAKTPVFTGANRHYKANVGYFVNKGPEYTKLAGDQPRMAVATVIISWPLNSEGDLDQGAMKAGKVKVQPWIFGQDKYDLFKPIHKNFHFGKHDVTIVCTDTQYQKMNFISCPNNILRKIKEGAPNHYKKLVEKVAQVAASIQSQIGQDLTLDQIREKMGTGGGGGGNGAAAAAAADPATTADIDNIVDGLLD